MLKSSYGGETVQRIVINFRNFIFSEAVELALKNNGDFHVLAVDEPCELVRSCRAFAANILLMEVAPFSCWTLEERLAIRNEMKASLPDCKIVLMTDERSEPELAKRVCDAKKAQLIDQFVYCSTSASYLSALLDTL
ncbi:MAG: hypothetical protein ACI4NQ_05450 [Christensenellales bacterium]|nr:hypothetical protein [Clostridium sp.]MDY2925646.1 hypothetical protein [Eubacteriales bacterium]MCI6987406.1 hypothetical protein [Clostridium sp.]MCI7012675.1 hypothetical protein [Clostridium sp.]MDD5904573.1 hypothetical protein [Clostridium sp.]